MRFMIIRKADAQTEAEDMPTEQLLADMGAYMEELARAGVLLGGDGLKPSRTGVRINFKDGTPSVVDGPFAETKELVAGYTLLQCGSMEEAVEWMKKWPRLDGNGNVSLEIRPLYEADDFGEAFTPELREQEDRLRNELAAKAAK
jgi:hypothetical protein